MTDGSAEFCIISNEKRRLRSKRGLRLKHKRKCEYSLPLWLCDCFSVEEFRNRLRYTDPFEFVPPERRDRLLWLISNDLKNKNNNRYLETNEKLFKDKTGRYRSWSLRVPIMTGIFLFFFFPKDSSQHFGGYFHFCSESWEKRKIIRESNFFVCFFFRFRKGKSTKRRGGRTRKSFASIYTRRDQI